MYNIGDIIELKIEKMVYEGFGLARKDGFVIFVEGVCDGDLVEAKITKVKKNFAYAEAENVINPSKYPLVFINNLTDGAENSIKLSRDNSISSNKIGPGFSFSKYSAVNSVIPAVFISTS